MGENRNATRFERNTTEKREQSMEMNMREDKWEDFNVGTIAYSCPKWWNQMCIKQQTMTKCKTNMMVMYSQLDLEPFCSIYFQLSCLNFTTY